VILLLAYVVRVTISCLAKRFHPRKKYECLAASQEIAFGGETFALLKRLAKTSYAALLHHA